MALKLVGITLIVATSLYALVLGLLFAFQQRVMFIPERLPAGFQFPVGEERWIGALHSLYFPSPDAAGTILYFHGNAGSLRGWGPGGAELARQSGFNVWMLDYPGYGKSQGGLASEAGLYQAAADFYAAAKQHEREERIVVFGQSIGTGFAIHLAATQNPGGLVLVSPYDSMKSLAGELLPWAPGFLVRYPIRSDLDAPRVRCPALVLHGEQDEVIPFRQGKRLSDRIKGVTLVPVPGAHHNDLSAFPAYSNSLAVFLRGLNVISPAR